eukprot:6338260-Pyramimonas_sp.AAC.1
MGGSEKATGACCRMGVPARTGAFPRADSPHPYLGGERWGEAKRGGPSQKSRKFPGLLRSLLGPSPETRRTSQKTRGLPRSPAF